MSTEETAELYFCGSVRCYVKGKVVAIVETGARGKPVMRMFEGPAKSNPKELAGYAVWELLADPGGFPLTGVHFVAHAGGPVLEDEPPADCDTNPALQQHWPTVMQSDLRGLAKSKRWRAAF